MSIKDIVVYQGINSFTYVVSLLILRAIVFKFGQENSEYDRYFAFGMALVVFGLLQLMTLNVTSRWVGMGRIVTQLPGTYEPNYYAFYLMIFVVFLLYTEKRKLNVLVLLISIALIIATRSNTGIIALLIIVVFRSRMEFGRKITLKTLTVIISILLVLIVICMVLWVGIMKLIFDSRIGVTLSNFLQSRDLNRLLSGRVLIWEAHLRAIFERDLPELLFGEAYQGGVYVEELGEEMTSHNFFIDLLNQNGMFGLLFFIVYIFFLLRSSIRLVISSRERSMVFSYLMVVLLFSLTLRLFSERAMWAILFSVESRIFNLGTKEVHDDRY